MQEIPTFNPHSLYPVSGILMPRSQIDGDTQMPDLLVPGDGGRRERQNYVERRFLMDLLESPVHWDHGVAQHVEVADVSGPPGTQHARVRFITFNPAVRLRIITAQTFRYLHERQQVPVCAIDDVQAEVLAIERGIDLDGHPWRTAVPVAGERPVRLCESVGFDLSPSGRKQYWPGRELAPIIDYLPHRFAVKVAYARYAIAARQARPEGDTA